MKKILVFITLLSFLTNISISAPKAKSVNFLSSIRLRYNAAGPALIKSDSRNDKIYVANALSSSVSIIDGKTDKVTNIPVGARFLQHLKNSAMDYNPRNGKVYVIGDNSIFIVDSKSKTAKTIFTEKQYESITVDRQTDNFFVVGRESSKLGFYDSEKEKFQKLDWAEKEEKLRNLNQTPPPPIRFVCATNDRKPQIIAVNGYDSTLYTFNPKNAELIAKKKINIGEKNGRWHLAGYSPNTRSIIIATETEKRKISQMAKLSIENDKDVIVDLPESFSEPVGFAYSAKLKEAYVCYDNNFFVHAVSFKNGGSIDSIAAPSFGNDALILDGKDNILYVASWSHGEIEVIDLEKRKFERKIDDLGILPHSFAFAFNDANKCIYYPLGATAVNGTFGAAITKLDPRKDKKKKIRTGWAPIDIIELPKNESFLIFNNEDQFAEVKYGGSYTLRDLPFEFPITSTYSPNGNVYLSYGPHQSYWPVVYIWGAKNGVLTIDKKDLSYYDRRIPRQAMQMILANNDKLYLEQNNWGREEQFLNVLEDEVRNCQIKKRIELGDTVQRETTQRVMEYDKKENLIYLARLAEKDGEASILQIINPDEEKVLKRIELGLNAVDVNFDEKYIYAANFESNSVSMIEKSTYKKYDIKAGKGPIKLLKAYGKVYVLNHFSRDIMEVKIPEINRATFGFELPCKGLADNMFAWNGKIVATCYSKEKLDIISFDPKTKKFENIEEHYYPYGKIGFDSGNSSFYVKGIFGDVVYKLSKGKTAANGNLWITDFLAGKLFIISE